TGRSVKQSQNRGNKPSPWPTCLNSRAPAFDVIVPPSNCATTARRPTASKSKRLGVHCVCIGGFRRITKCRCGTTAFADSRPRCAQMFEKSGLVVPSHPGLLASSPAELREAFDVAVEELERSRCREPSRTGYAAECHTAAFDAGWRALADSACGIVREQNPDAPCSHANPAPAVPQLHVVASGPGSGKTTAAK